MQFIRQTSVLLAFILIGCSSPQKQSPRTARPIQNLGDLIYFNTQDPTKRATEDLFADLDACLKVCPDPDRPHARTLQMFFKNMHELLDKHKFGQKGGMTLKTISPEARNVLAALIGASESLEKTTDYLVDIYFLNQKYQASIADFIYILAPAHNFYTKIAERKNPTQNLLLLRLEESAQKLTESPNPTATAWYIRARSPSSVLRTDLERVRNWHNCLLLNPLHTECQKGYQSAVLFYQRPICRIDSPRLRPLFIGCEARNLEIKKDLREFSFQGTRMLFERKSGLLYSSLQGLDIVKNTDGAEGAVLTFKDQAHEMVKKLVSDCRDYRVGLAVGDRLLTVNTVTPEYFEHFEASRRLAFQFLDNSQTPDESNPPSKTVLCEEYSRELPADLRVSSDAKP